MIKRIREKEKVHVYLLVGLPLFFWWWQKLIEINSLLIYLSMGCIINHLTFGAELQSPNWRDALLTTSHLEASYKFQTTESEVTPWLINSGLGS